MSAVDEIKERLDIVETISAYVPLKRAGRHYKGLCPFHAEKTPSFVVFPETGTWHCFGACSTGGDIFTFIMRRENLDFQEALELLARRAGIELEPRQPQMQEEERHLERLRAVCAAATVYFHELLLNHAQAEPAPTYNGVGSPPRRSRSFNWATPSMIGRQANAIFWRRDILWLTSSKRAW